MSNTPPIVLALSIAGLLLTLFFGAKIRDGARARKVIKFGTIITLSFLFISMAVVSAFVIEQG